MFLTKLSDPSFDWLKSFRSSGQPYKYTLKGLEFSNDFS